MATALHNIKQTASMNLSFSTQIETQNSSLILGETYIINFHTGTNDSNFLIKLLFTMLLILIVLVDTHVKTIAEH